MTVSSRRTGDFVHDAKSYALGYGRARNIHDQFRVFQDLRWSRSQVPDGFFDSITADPPNSRCIAGLLNGNMGVVKSMMGELTDTTNRAQVSGLFPLVWSVGATIGYVTRHHSAHKSHHYATVLWRVDRYHAHTKDFRPCSEIGFGRNTHTSYRACFPLHSVPSASFLRGYS